MDVRDCVKPAIEKTGLKQSVVAERMGLTQQQLCDVINKRRKLEANEFINLCAVLEISPNNLLAYAIEDKSA